MNKPKQKSYRFAVGKSGSLDSEFIVGPVAAVRQCLCLVKESLLLKNIDLATSVDINFLGGISLQLQGAQNTSLDVQSVGRFSNCGEELSDSSFRGLEDQVLSFELSAKSPRLLGSLEMLLVLALH